jgi:hypothetical protein
MNELTEGIGSLSDLVKQDPPNHSDFQIEYKQETRNMTRSQLLNDYGEIIDKLRVKETKMSKEFQEIEQILGKALGFPWFKDDQKNFPNTTEADGVCVGEHTAWTLAKIAADKIKSYEEGFDESLETIELTDIPKNATILPCGLEIWQTEDLFIILKDSQDSVAFEKKHLPDLVDALIELQNI